MRRMGRIPNWAPCTRAWSGSLLLLLRPLASSTHAEDRYPGAGPGNEVLRERLCSMEQRKAEDAHRLEALRAAVQLGAADIAAGRFKSFDTKASLREHLKSVGCREGNARSTI